MAISTLKMADLFLVPYVRSVWEMLRYRLGARRDSRTSVMCLFGAGAHTRWLLSVTQDLPRLPIECILDDDPVDESLAGIAVRRPVEIDVEKIALSGAHAHASVGMPSRFRWTQELTCHEALVRGVFALYPSRRTGNLCAEPWSPLEMEWKGAVGYLFDVRYST